MHLKKGGRDVYNFTFKVVKFFDIKCVLLAILFFKSAILKRLQWDVNHYNFRKILLGYSLTLRHILNYFE